MLSSMPAGHSLAHYKGSLLVARGSWLYISEAYRYGLFNLGRGFIPFLRIFLSLFPVKTACMSAQTKLIGRATL